MCSVSRFPRCQRDADVDRVHFDGEGVTDVPILGVNGIVLPTYHRLTRFAGCSVEGQFGGKARLDAIFTSWS